LTNRTDRVRARCTKVLSALDVFLFLLHLCLHLLTRSQSPRRGHSDIVVVQLVNIRTLVSFTDIRYDMYYCAPRERGRGGRERDRASLCAAYIRDRRHLCSPSNTTSFYEMFSLHSFPSVQGVVCVEHNIIEMRNCMHTACSNLPHNPHTYNTHITRARFSFLPLFSSSFHTR